VSCTHTVTRRGIRGPLALLRVRAWLRIGPILDRVITVTRVSLPGYLGSFSAARWYLQACRPSPQFDSVAPGSPSPPLSERKRGPVTCRLSRSPHLPPSRSCVVSVSFTRISLHFIEGNFGGNQLLNGSIGLSPLYSSLTNDLHVSTATAFHQDFSWLQPTQA
jgi:hypothetical protein